MGYDDNTPLSGVTGGGLPTDIWREVMSRVHEGLPLRDLPMDVPAPPSGLGEAPDQGLPIPVGNGNGQGSRPGNIIDQVLNDIFGGGSDGGGNRNEPLGRDR
jgi:membrane peptidoglycan carboxypeptidase